jgi:hypothetical protein
MVKARFVAERSHLVVTEVTNGWCQVAIETPDGTVVLGAEGRERLRDGLTRVAQNSGDLVAPEDAGLRWALSLAEGHSTIYTRADGASVAIVIQDAEGRPRFTDRITRVSDWVSEASRL